MTMKIGFVGFGEAAQCLIAGLKGEGLNAFAAWDIEFALPLSARGERLTAALDRLGVHGCASNAELMAWGADVVFSAVTADQCLAAAQQSAETISDGQVFIDINSAAPMTKIEACAAIEARGGVYIESAVMESIPHPRHRAPILFAAKNAPAVAEKLNAFNMNIAVVSDRVGAASTAKMCRSVFVKGLEAIMTECVLAARAAGVEDRVIDSLGQTYPQFDWREQATYLIGRVVEHGKRRAAEMENVGDTLAHYGIEPLMARATAARQRSVAELDLSDATRQGAQGDLDKLLDAIAPLRQPSSRAAE